MNYLQLMRPIIQKAGDLVLSYFRQEITVSYKKNKSIVTNVDLLCENFLKEELSKILPGPGFIAEESKISNMQEFTWVIDPIDGTKNFVRGLPYFCINVALMHHDEIIAAVTYQPVLKEWFYAQKGEGAFCNEVKAALQQPYTSTGALVVVSDSLLRKVDDVKRIKEGLKAVEHGVKFRVNGAVALDLAYTACGMFDLVIFQNLAWWDIAAGILLIQEAGGMVRQLDGLPVTQKSQTLIAGDSNLCKLVQKFDKSRKIE